MMQTISRRTVAVVLACAVAGVSSADARPRPGRAAHFEANKEFGLGLMVGAPTGLSGKYFFAPDRALDFGLGGIGYYRGRSGLHMHVDYLWHPVSLVHAQAFELPFYVGIGGRLFDFDYGDPNGNAFAIGVRVPFGIAFDFNETPIDIFFELAFVADFLTNYRDQYDAEIDGAIGFRYYFN